MKVVVIVQARMGSTRLPGKVLLFLENKTVLGHVISRVAQAHGINQIVVATSNHAKDDAIEEEVLRLGVSIYRGSELNVLERYYEAAQYYHADVIVRITSDCPLLDPVLLTSMIQDFLTNHQYGRVDYLSNCLVRSYPRGLDIEIFSMDALRQAYSDASSEHEKEHVTPYLYQHPNLYKLINYQNKNDLSHHRWTLDTADDMLLISLIYQELYKHSEFFSTEDILKLFNKNPWFIDINKHVEQKKDFFLKDYDNVAK